MTDKQTLLSNIELIVDKLMNLGEADNESDKSADSESFKKGIIARDFGIKEWDWPQGVGLFGLIGLQEYYGDERYMEFLANWFSDNIAYGLPSKNVNTTAPYLSLLAYAIKTDNKEYMDMCIDRAEWLMNELPKTRENGFQHVTSALGDRNGVMLNDSEIWLDTLFMTVLFLNKMGQFHKRQDWIDQATHQILVHIKYLYDKQDCLFFHGWSFNRNDNFGGIYWCRGNSWFTISLMEYIKDSKDTLDAGTKEFLIDTFLAQASRLKELQGDDGLWHTVLDDTSSYTEVSGSAAIVKGLIAAQKMNVLGSDYDDVISKAITGICKNIDRDGTVLNVSAGTGMGFDADHYKNIILAPMAYGQSLALLALVEAL